jgi:RNA ligase (TIGR02306 family)
MRKLATIQKISAIRPIPGADRIVVADVLGWSVVVGKDEFNVGDLAVYFEIDSWLDSSIPAFQSDVFEPRYTNWGTKRGMRLKTIKLRKQISQGLLMPIDKFPELLEQTRSGDYVCLHQEGADVTEILKIEKWEAPEETASNAGGIAKAAGSKQFPSFIQKTDQERVQNYMNLLHKHKDETFEVTTKLDGSSMTVYHVGKDSPHFQHIVEDQELRALKKMSRWQKLWYNFKKKIGFGPETEPFFQGVCSRNIQLGLNDGSHFTTFAKERGILEALENFERNIAIQGELIGPTIQGNYEKMDKFGFFVYDIWDIDKQAYFLPADARRICEELGFDYVPVLDVAARLPEGAPREVVDALLAHAEGPGMNKGVKREGTCWKSNQTPFSMKCISNSYLLHKEGK